MWLNCRALVLQRERHVQAEGRAESLISSRDFYFQMPGGGQGEKGLEVRAVNPGKETWERQSCQVMILPHRAVGEAALSFTSP